MKRNLLILFCTFGLLFFVTRTTMAQDATREAAPIATVEPLPVEIIDGGNTIVNVGGETPSDATETPVEPMPWWVVAGLEIGKYTGLYLAFVYSVRAALSAFMNNPARVTAAENSVNLIKSVTPDALEDAARLGAEKAFNATRELLDDARRAIIELTDGIPANKKSVSISSTGTPDVSTLSTPSQDGM